MRRNRAQRGRGGNGRGGRGGHGGGGYRGGRGNGGGGRGRGRGRGGRGPMMSSGNQRERITIESGALVLIDQFMLANPQFIQKFNEILDEGADKKDALIAEYGGTVVKLTPGTYRIDRDPFAMSIIVHGENSDTEHGDIDETVSDHIGDVFVDTRCLAMIDRELLDDSQLLEKYQQLWFSGDDKACRDLIRDNGGAVRYGFQRYGDVLAVYNVPNDNIICLWPKDRARSSNAHVTQAMHGNA